MTVIYEIFYAKLQNILLECNASLCTLKLAVFIEFLTIFSDSNILIVWFRVHVFFNLTQFFKQQANCDLWSSVTQFTPENGRD